MRPLPLRGVREVAVSSEPVPDDRLINLVTQGDQESLGVLYDRYGKAVFGFTLYLLKDPHRAEEVTQEVFLNVWLKADKFNLERGTFHAWLMTMAHHRAIDEMRRETRQWQKLQQAARESAPPQNSLVDTTADTAQRSQEGEVVRNALATIPEEQRRVIELAYYQGLTHSDISSRLGQPLGTVKIRMRLGMQKLRIALDGHLKANECNKVSELIPHYALGALEATEMTDVEEHLNGCPDCDGLTREHLAASVALGALAPPVEPPAALRNRIMAAVGAQTLDRAAPVLPASVPTPVATGWRLWGGWRLGVTGVAASVSLLLIGALLGLLLDVRSDLRELRSSNEELTALVVSQRDFSYVAAMPGITPMTLQSTEETPRARSMLMASPDHTWGVLYSLGLQPQADEMAYQVWFIRDGIRFSGGVFSVDDTGYGQIYIRFPTDLYDFSGIGITEEPMEGSLAPSSEPILTARIH
jgi:RNA polymerase sigma-70 factor (ECF subfamily)